MTTPLPNFIFFVADQWRGDVLGHLGNPAAHTPVLDAWAASEAVSFRHAFVQSPVCTPSRCSFMTGWYPHVRGHRTMHHMLQPDEPMLLRSLKEASYYVWLGGKNDVIAAQFGYQDYCNYKYPGPGPDRPCRPDLHSYDSWRGSPGQPGFYSFYGGRLEKLPNFPADEPFYYDYDWHNLLGAIDFIHHAPGGQPWCIDLNLGFPHPPYAVEDPWYSQIDLSKLPRRVPTPQDWSGKPGMLAGIYKNQNLQSWSEEQWTELRRTYYGMCARVDYQFGLLLQALRESGQYENTAVFFFADHGDFTGDYGLVEKSQNTFEDCLIRVPLLIKPPAWTLVKPRVSPALVELVDFPATVEALADIQPAHTHFGRSLLPVLAGETDLHRAAVFCEGGRIRGEVQAMEPMNEQQGKNWLYWPRLEVQHHDDAAHTKAVMCRTQDFKYVRRLYEQDELYDLRNDPQEQHNRISDPALAAVRSELQEKVLDFLMKTGDVVPKKYDSRG